jgi:transcriptional regulator with GAF, ATPase, and Fis domain
MSEVVKSSDTNEKAAESHGEPANESSLKNPPAASSRETLFGRRITLRSLRAATEIQAISRALEETGWNRRLAAELLSISYRGLLYKIRQHNITRPAPTGLPSLELKRRD